MAKEKKPQITQMTKIQNHLHPIESAILRFPNEVFY